MGPRGSRPVCCWTVTGCRLWGMRCVTTCAPTCPDLPPPRPKTGPSSSPGTHAGLGGHESTLWFTNRKLARSVVSVAAGSQAKHQGTRASGRDDTSHTQVWRVLDAPCGRRRSLCCLGDQRTGAQCREALGEGVVGESGSRHAEPWPGRPQCARHALASPHSSDLGEVAVCLGCVLSPPSLTGAWEAQTPQAGPPTRSYSVSLQ